MTGKENLKHLFMILCVFLHMLITSYLMSKGVLLIISSPSKYLGVSVFLILYLFVSLSIFRVLKQKEEFNK